MLIAQSRLGIERIDLARPAIHVQKDDTFGPRLEMRQRLMNRLVGCRFAGADLAAFQECCQRYSPEAAARLAQKMAPVQRQRRVASASKHGKLADETVMPSRPIQRWPSPKNKHYFE